MPRPNKSAPPKSHWHPPDFEKSGGCLGPSAQGSGRRPTPISSGARDELDRSHRNMRCTVLYHQLCPPGWRIVRTRDTQAISPVTTVSLSPALPSGQLTVWAVATGESSNSICFVLSAFILLMTLLPRETKDAVADRISIVLGAGLAMVCDPPRQRRALQSASENPLWYPGQSAARPPHSARPQPAGSWQTATSKSSIL